MLLKLPNTYYVKSIYYSEPQRLARLSSSERLRRYKEKTKKEFRGRLEKEIESWEKKQNTRRMMEESL